MFRPSVAIIGAGFSGLLTALHLLADPDGPQVRLFERRGVFGRGQAYSSDNPDHLLNVRVGNMSAFPDDPDHFVRWLSTHSGWRSGGGFVTRAVYGEYLQGLLRAAVSGGCGAGRLLLEADEAVSLKPVAGRWRLETALGKTFQVDAAVLAVGSAPPAPPAGLDIDLQRSGRYIADPWSAAALEGDLGAHVVLLGTGLTMIDAVLGLARPGRRFTAISRRGLVPQIHGQAMSTTPASPLAATPLQALRHLRELTDDGDWRSVVDGVRSSVRPLWMSWSQDQRRAFLRHLRPWWDVHRHRMAPAVARRIEELRDAGDLVVHAGVVQRTTLHTDDVHLDWRPRGARRLRHLKADAVINCTGAQGDLSRIRDALVRDLIAQDLLRPDPCALGADVDARSRPLNRWGAPTPGLYAVGPLTRGAFWEVTSVPDIRVQARDVSLDVARELRVPA